MISKEVTGMQTGDSNEKRRETNINSFIDQISQVEQRILISLTKADTRKIAINRYKEAILIRELFGHFKRYLNPSRELSSEQYAVSRRIWNKAFKTAMDASKKISNASVVSRIENKMMTIFASKDALI